jgi:hypothetical protein
MASSARTGLHPTYTSPNTFLSRVPNLTSKQPLRGGLIERISGIQLFANSHDQGYASDPSAGNWTWFEIGIIKGKNSSDKGRNLTWTSHFNRFLSSEYGWVRCLAP